MLYFMELFWLFDVSSNCCDGIVYCLYNIFVKKWIFYGKIWFCVKLVGNFFEWKIEEVYEWLER